MSNPPSIPPRPQTPQAMLHRLPDKSEDESSQDAPPSKYIILITGSTAVAGKVQIATSVSKALSCPLFQGDSLHELSAKAASLGTSRQQQQQAAATASTAAASEAGSAATAPPGPNEARYQRMWLSKMTRTGLLFPDESRPANQGFSGFGGSSTSTSTSRRGSVSSVASASSSSSDVAASDASSLSNVAVSGASATTTTTTPTTTTAQYVNKPPMFSLPEEEALRRANPALMVLTHPELERWHKVCIKKTVGEYRIGVIFVPLYDDDDFPRLRMLDPRTMTSFASFGSFLKLREAAASSSSSSSSGEGLTADDVLRIDIDGDVEGITEEIVQGARDVMRIVS